MNRYRFAAAAGALAALGLLQACSTPLPATTPAVETAVPTPVARAGSPIPPPVQATAAAPAAAPESKVASVTLPAHLDAASAISRERSVYFDFDDSALKPEYVALIERHAKYLVANAALAVRIEGHTDERGGPEYNLALGQRRAESVLRSLRLLGVKGNQLEAISYGEERPRASGHDESAWAQNRRADIAYPTR